MSSAFRFDSNTIEMKVLKAPKAPKPGVLTLQQYMSSTGQSVKSISTTKGEKYHFHGIHKDSSSGLFQSSIKPQLHRSLRTGSSLALLLYG